MDLHRRMESTRVCNLPTNLLLFPVIGHEYSIAINLQLR